MKPLMIAVCMCAALFTGVASAQQKPGVVTTTEVETVVTVRGVHHANRTVTVEGPDGNLVTIQVPPESQNLDQIYPGAKFKVRYLEAVAVGVVKGGGAPDVQVAEDMQLAPKGGTPGGVIARIVRITGTVEAIDQANRTIVVRGPQGNLREFAVSEAVENFDQLKVGDTVGLQVAQALATTMIKE